MTFNKIYKSSFVLNFMSKNKIWIKHLGMSIALIPYTPITSYYRKHIGKHNGKSKLIRCSFCNKQIKRCPSMIKKINFCNSKCRKKWLKNHKIDYSGRNYWNNLPQNRIKKIKKKIREKLEGRKLSFETKLKISKSLSGKKGINWKGGISFEPYGKKFNRQLKLKILKRDKYKCCECNSSGIYLHIHHIDYNKKNNRPTNLISLCNSCHSKTISPKKRKFWKERLSKKIEKKYNNI